MNIDNPLSKFSIDYWYHALMVVGVAIFILSATGALTELPVGITSAISAGIFFFGLGEWINHPYISIYREPTSYHPGGHYTGHLRSTRLAGVIFDVIGLVLILFGLFKLISAPGA